MPRQKKVTLEQVAATIREEFTTLNVLVQALNRELRDIMLTARAEQRKIARRLGIRPGIYRAGSKRTLQRTRKSRR